MSTLTNHWHLSCPSMPIHSDLQTTSSGRFLASAVFGRRNELLVIAAALLPNASLAQTATRAASDAMPISSYDLPPSIFASQQASQAASAAARKRREALANGGQPRSIDQRIAGDGIAKVRREVDAAQQPMLERMRTQFSVKITDMSIGGVPVHMVTPTAGVSRDKAKRVLINLHGGGFVTGARYEGVLASTPIAALAGYKVISINYRMGPEHRYPAASEDVATVYRALLADHRPEDIGIFGCSAGAILTAQSVAWFQTHDLPRPGAIVLDSGGAVAGMLGDSYYFYRALSGTPATLPSPERGFTYLTNYFPAGSMTNPLQSPLFSPSIPARFPATLLVSASRDFMLSSVIATHSKLRAAGIAADLALWDGVGHCFTYDGELPEAREAYQRIAAFFDAKLGSRSTKRVR